MAYIYKITNNINGKMYIGKTEKINPKGRWKEHLRDARNPNRNHRALYRAINKYGSDNFSFEIIEETLSPEEREIYYIAHYNTYHNGYNETLGGDGASYLELPELDICKTYLEVKSIEKTAKIFQYDISTIKKVLYKNNIQLYPISTTLKKAVAKINKDTNEIIEIYKSVSDAERANGNTRHIAQVCIGKRKLCKGYKWKYVDDI